MSTHDDTYTCDHDGCSCRVADDITHPQNRRGEIYCSDGCRHGRGCACPGCNCADVTAPPDVV
jgi:hypothetical protein